jgi:hypothetical protein
MDADNAPAPLPTPSADLARWAALLAEMSELHAKLEYMRLMLRLGAADLSSER